MICPKCEQECELVDMILLRGQYVCMDCVRIERQQRLDGWNAVRTEQVAIIQSKLTELNSIPVLNRLEMYAKIGEIQSAIQQLKNYTEAE